MKAKGMKAVRFCSIDGCRKKHFGLGFCCMHHARFKKYGSPLLTHQGHGYCSQSSPYRFEYRVWCGMMLRCGNSKSHAYSRYGGRGIRVCSSWQNSFETFLRDVGPCPGKNFSIDRIDNDGNYEPGNVRWASAVLQARNRKTNHIITISGVAKSIAGWCELLRVNPRTVMSRIRRGWRVCDLFSLPVRKWVCCAEEPGPASASAI